ncbi:bacteriorhodopsin [Halobacteriales archaeon Cl-PHB]
MSPTVGSPTVVPLLLQSEALDRIRDDALLSASLWTNVALAGLTVLLFVYMARRVSDTRARLIFGATVFISLVSLVSYLGLLSGLTVGVIEMPPGHPLGGEEVLSQWGRYLTWTFSTPLILVALGLLADADLAEVFAIVVADVMMCVTGLAAALTTASYAFRWVFYGVSSAFFLVVLYGLLRKWPASARGAGTGDIFATLRTLTVVLWLGYPVVWALGVEGLAIVDSTALTSWGYSLLDIGAKYVFAYLLLRWVADNEATVRATGDDSTSGTAAVAED